MTAPKDKIAMVIYANPDYYPPVINAIQILVEKFDLLVICRNQDAPQFDYPKNLKVYRLGKLKTAREKEKQNFLIKISEYLSFLVCAIWLIRFYRCRVIYSYDMYGLITGFLASRLGRSTPLIYHNLDLCPSGNLKDLSYPIKYLELRLARYAQRIVFPDINRAEFFQEKGKLAHSPEIVMNAPLRIKLLPEDKLKVVLTQKGFSRDTKVVLYQGAINKEHCLLEVTRSMAYWPENTILVLSGIVYDNVLEEIYQEAEKLNLRERIIKNPFLSYSGLFSYTVGAYLGLALFKAEDINQTFVAGASNKIFEYISLGIPVITNDQPHFHEVLGASVAYFAKPDSIPDIARVINIALSDTEEYHKKSEAARREHLTKFNYEEQFKPVLEYLKKVMNNSIQ